MVCRGKPGDDLVLSRLIECVERVGGERVEVVLDEETARRGRAPGLKKQEKKQGKKQGQGTKIGEMSVDFLVCVGGDGTILRTLHYLKGSTPVLGVNMGALGFLAAVQPEDAVSTLSGLLDRGFEVERRERLSVSVAESAAGAGAGGGRVGAGEGRAGAGAGAGAGKGEKEGEKVPYAMNEAVVVTSKPGKMLHFSISVDGDELEQLRADGVVFATPTGSTAYAMSAGGPIVDPKLNAAIIVPIAPFKLSARPTVVNIDTTINLELLGAKEAELVVDGQFYRKIGREDRISITRGEPAFFVKIRDKHFLRLHDKLRIEDEK